MRTHMLACKCIIAQIHEAQANKKSFPVVMQVNYAGSRSRLPRTSTPFSDHAPAARRLWFGLVLARVCRDRPLGARGRRVGLDGLQPIIGTLRQGTPRGRDAMGCSPQ